MNTATESIDEPRISASTLRVRRHRMRRREGLRLLTVEIPEPVIEATIARGLPHSIICRIYIPPDDTRQAHDALEICLRVFRAQDRKYLLAVENRLTIGEDVETTLAARHKRRVTFTYRCHRSAPALQAVAAPVAY
jgi:hypothetical protein